MFSDMKVECFPGIRTEQLHRAIENTDLAHPDTVVISIYLYSSQFGDNFYAVSSSLVLV